MITVDQYNGVGVLTIEQEFTGDDAKKARTIVQDLIDKHQIANFAVDLEKCSTIDSDGLESLLWIKQRCDDLFGAFKVVNPDENCRKIFEITRLGHRFDIGADLTVALKAMR